MLPRHPASLETSHDDTSIWDRIFTYFEPVLGEREPLERIRWIDSDHIEHSEEEHTVNPTTCLSSDGDGHASATIRIRDASRMWRIAMLSFFPEEGANYISRRVVVDILRAPIMEDLDSQCAFDNRIKTRGHVRLVWSMYRTKKSYESVFRVSEEFDPWYDILLGNDTMSFDGIQYPSTRGLHKPVAKPAKTRKHGRRRTKQKETRGGREQIGQERKTLPSIDEFA